MSKKKHIWPNFQHFDPLCGVLSTHTQSSIDHCQLRCSWLDEVTACSHRWHYRTWSHSILKRELPETEQPTSSGWEHSLFLIKDNHLLRHFILGELEIQSCINLCSRDAKQPTRLWRLARELLCSFPPLLSKKSSVRLTRALENKLHQTHNFNNTKLQKATRCSFIVHYTTKF